MALFQNEKLIQLAYNYPSTVASDVLDYLSNTNAWRVSQGLQPLYTIYVPRFNSQQLLRDASRGYNGFARRDQFGNQLHEYMVNSHVDSNFGLVIDIDVNSVAMDSNNHLIAWAVWSEVTTAQRIALGQNPNTANYVDRIIAALSQ